MADTITAWRIVKRRFAEDAFSGEGARRYGGRWNEIGTAVAYTAESRALAALELLVHLTPPGRLGLFWLVPVSFPRLAVETIDPARLPVGWNSPAPLSDTAAFGTAWAASQRSLVLRVPSAIVPGEWNYVITMRHPQRLEVVMGAPQAFAFDPRLS